MQRLRWQSLTAIPASASLKIKVIWVSVNRDCFIQNLLFQCARKSYFWTVRIPVKPATQSGESGHPVGAKRRWGFHDVSGGRFESM